MGDFFYDGSANSLREACALHQRGIAIRCPKCRAQLIVALTVEEANQKKVHPGIYCPNDRTHVFTILELKK